MRILVDENLDSEDLMARLRKAGHHIETLAKALDDASIWQHAQANALVVLTANPPDFESLAAATPAHHGSLLIYGEGLPRKQMRPADIAEAVEFVRTIFGEHLGGHVLDLNAWRRPRE
ncbi:MAG TPA: DUF5615 family PIN-like protein [Candidatus Limnocylindria bacterium]